MSKKDFYGITILYSPTTTRDSSSNSEQCSATFDLVAIHGLNGDPLVTWTHRESGVMWPRDLLPEAFPNCRVMTYGYNALFKNFTAEEDLRGTASKLLSELVGLRNTKELLKQKSRPIVFVCHSLGGIVAKKALIIGCPIEEEKVQRAVYGILFLGTPHGGSSLAKLGKTLGNIAAACTPLRPPITLVGHLQKDSEVLSEISKDFIHRCKKVHIVSFYETERTPIPPFFKILIVKKSSAVMDIERETTVGQYSDHRDIVRFATSRDRNFRSVLFQLQILGEGINKEFYGISSPSPHVPPAEAQGFPGVIEIPIHPCHSFRGRDDVLKKMQAYFSTTKSHTQGRRTFAICGLGGSGKTQTALHFMRNNLWDYKTGVFWLNAASEASLAADFSRLHDLLRLGEADDKRTSVKRWLSRGENSQWLIVFDNADDLRSVPLQKYIPVAPWGHVIITSCDQGVLGNIAEEGLSLGPLGSEDAVAILLDRASIPQPSVNDKQLAEEIVGLLGCLPLAVVQAGALMRARHKSLKQYRDLYVRQGADVLKFHPNLGDFDKTVLTVWEMNFQDIEEDSKDATKLLLLFCFLEPSAIPEEILYRGASPQKRWGEDGEMTEISAEDEGLDKDLVRLILNEIDFDIAIERLLSFSFITCNREVSGMRNFSIHPLVQYCATRRISASTASTYRQQAILLICHAFPRNRYLEPQYGDLGRVMLPQLSRVLVEYDKMNMEYGSSPPFRDELTATLLAATRFSETQWKVEAISRAKELLNDATSYLNAWLTYRESAVLRMCGKRTESDDVLEKFINSKALASHDIDPEANPRYNSHRGDLIISFAENLTQQDRLEDAINELRAWSPLNPSSPSSMERVTFRALNTVVGKTLRYQGHFSRALSLLEELLEEAAVDDFFEGSGWYRVLLSEIANLYCELDRPRDAEELLRRELRPILEKGTQDIATGRRLRLALAETFIQRRMFDSAEEDLLRLKELYEVPGKPGYNATRDTFRVLLGLARISHWQAHWEKALSYWNQALSITTERLQKGESFDASLVRYSMAHALYMTGRKSESDALLAEATSCAGFKRRRFWIAGFNSKWYDYIVNEIAKLH